MVKPWICHILYVFTNKTQIISTHQHTTMSKIITPYLNPGLCRTGRTIKMILGLFDVLKGNWWGGVVVLKKDYNCSTNKSTYVHSIVNKAMH